jgi:hypothetical protein
MSVLCIKFGADGREHLRREWADNKYIPSGPSTKWSVSFCVSSVWNGGAGATRNQWCGDCWAYIFSIGFVCGLVGIVKSTGEHSGAAIAAITLSLIATFIVVGTAA